LVTRPILRLAFFDLGHNFTAAMTLAQRTAAATQEIQATLGRLPEPVREFAKNIPVHYEARPPAHIVEEGFPADILGLFDGSAHGEELTQDQAMPPQISLYLDNIWDFVEQDREEFIAEVGITYLHELGHYFGWDEEELAERDLE
jgi:predicted Zn-dependent protease with MMP-like domain